MKYLYISDLHIGHFNILKLDNRPFTSVEEMHKTIINNWNNKVGNDDTVFILGDISWMCERDTVEFYNKLNGSKVLIKGNHDLPRNIPKGKTVFDGIYDYKEIIDNQQRVVLSHYPIPFWSGQFHDSIHLYGHVHNTVQETLFRRFLRDTSKTCNIPAQAYNVGCMMPWMNYTPQTLTEIIQKSSEYLQA